MSSRAIELIASSLEACGQLVAGNGGSRAQQGWQVMKFNSRTAEAEIQAQ
jgi:hypothetical protein